MPRSVAESPLATVENSSFLSSFPALKHENMAAGLQGSIHRSAIVDSFSSFISLWLKVSMQWDFQVVNFEAG